MSTNYRRRSHDCPAEDLGINQSMFLDIPSVSSTPIPHPNTHDYDYTILTPRGPHIVRIEGSTITCLSHDDIREEIVVLTLGGLPCVCVGAALYLDFQEGEWGKTFFDHNQDLYEELLSVLPDWYAKVLSTLARQRRQDTGGKGPPLCMVLPL